jgi:hypothetical protein
LSPTGDAIGPVMIRIVTLGSGVVSALVPEVVVTESVVNLEVVVRLLPLVSFILFGVARRRSDDWSIHGCNGTGGGLAANHLS